ncbi:LLM class flavin-dependent oxidoreductase [Arthrobacter sp. NIO-1057]|uniref:LLM class flavin-dependent oxidoreductase n=1 Tax=Arthrobacter sp. NIO-1057 TaxID=993071 RepID=UPI00071CFBDF|nr:LLM class flavin-dependent oxidoreductase [Arthrobacter sp. NIO-1057]KSU65571.1 5,10-methylene tetrahydromethanopterin reductase [Arthrobacter sp. NIO-1057]SCC38473.1 FMN-dependent oxidoreductase, nitrilotriacetate monooxygenase family [Arthrobacter sp. NIO-1057]
MSQQREILFNAFDMNCVVHQSPGLWRHPEDKASTYNTIGYWTHLAKVLEKGKFDGLFIADVLGTYDVFNGTNESPLRSGAQAPVNDPMMLVSAMAAVTENLGFGVTAGTAYEHPYAFARRLATLDHLTNGRVGWNVVTGYLPSAARNMGQEDQMEHDERYNHADEYLEVVYKLLEGSWEDDAVQNNKETGIYTDPAKVHNIEHEGKYFKVPGIAITEPSTQRTPVIYQAGASSRGIKFASENAEAVFVTSPTREILKATVTKIRDAAEAAGRDRYDVKIFAMQTIITDETSEKARAKYEDYKSYADVEGAQVLISGWMGVDLSELDPDEPLGSNVKSNAIQSSVETFQKASGDDGNPWTIRQLAEWVGVGGFGPITVGSGAEVAEKLIDWVDYTDVDGFNLAYAVTPATFEDVVEYVVPELQARGAYKTEYAEGSLRNKLFGAGDRVKDTHRAAKYKIANRVAAQG